MTSIYCKSCYPSFHKDWSSHLQNPTLKCCGKYYFANRYDNPCNRFPLYDAINNRAPDAVILTLLEANKTAAMTRDVKDGWSPLEKAIALKHSDNVILAFLAANKDVAKTSLIDGGLALHKALEYKYSNDVIRAFLEA